MNEADRDMVLESLCYSVRDLQRRHDKLIDLIYNLNQRLLAHECQRAAEQIDEPRVNH